MKKRMIVELVVISLAIMGTWLFTYFLPGEGETMDKYKVTIAAFLTWSIISLVHTMFVVESGSEATYMGWISSFILGVMALIASSVIILSCGYYELFLVAFGCGVLAHLGTYRPCVRMWRYYLNKRMYKSILSMWASMSKLGIHQVVHYIRYGRWLSFEIAPCKSKSEH